MKDWGGDITLDIRRQIISGKKYILLMDDANRISFLESFLEQAVPDVSVKYVLTVRDYGWEAIQWTISLYKSTALLDMYSLNAAQLIEIISSAPFDITDPEIHDRVIEIAHGNCRIALMCVGIVKENKDLMSLYDVSHVYNVYFSEHYGSLKKEWGIEGLKVLGLICFYGTIDKSQRKEVEHIFETFHINEERFWEICHRLHDAEVIYLTDFENVYPIDQVFASFVFYKVFLEETWLDFLTLLDLYVEPDSYISYDCFLDTLHPVTSTYSLEHVADLIRGMLLPRWEEVIQTKVYGDALAILDVVALYVPGEVLEWIGLYAEANDERIPDILLKITVLDDYFYECMELLCTYLTDNNTLVSYTVKQLEYTFVSGYSMKRVVSEVDSGVFDFLIEQYEMGVHSSFYREMLWGLIPVFLKNEFSSDDVFEHRLITRTAYLSPCDCAYNFRQRIWTFIRNDFDRERFFSLLPNLYTSEYNREACREIAIGELGVIGELLRYLDLEGDYEACVVVDCFFRKLQALDIVAVEHFQVTPGNKYFLLDQSLKGEDIDSRYQLPDGEAYQNLFLDMDMLQQLKIDKEENRVVYTCILEMVLEREADLFRELLLFVFASTSVPLVEDRLLLAYFQREKEVRKLYGLLNSLPGVVSQRWLWTFHNTVPEELVLTGLERYATDFYSLLERLQFIPRFLVAPFIKYATFMPQEQGWSRAITHVMRLYEQECTERINEESLAEMIRCCPERLDDLEQLYFLTKDPEGIFDGENLILKELLLRKPDVILHYYECFLPADIRFVDIENFKLGFIFDLANYKEILEKVIWYLHAIEEEYKPAKMQKLMVLLAERPVGTEKKLHEFLLDFIFANSSDVGLMVLVFRMVIDIFEPETPEKYALYRQFIRSNKHVKAFKCLPLHSFRNKYENEILYFRDKA